MTSFKVFATAAVLFIASTGFAQQSDPSDPPDDLTVCGVLAQSTPTTTFEMTATRNGTSRTIKDLVDDDGSFCATFNGAPEAVVRLVFHTPTADLQVYFDDHTDLQTEATMSGWTMLGVLKPGTSGQIIIDRDELP